MSTAMELNDDVLLVILSFLPPEAQCQTLRTCKPWRARNQLALTLESRRTAHLRLNLKFRRTNPVLTWRGVSARLLLKRRIYYNKHGAALIPLHISMPRLRATLSMVRFNVQISGEGVALVTKVEAIARALMSDLGFPGEFLSSIRAGNFRGTIDTSMAKYIWVNYMNYGVAFGNYNIN